MDRRVGWLAAALLAVPTSLQAQIPLGASFPHASVQPALQESGASPHALLRPALSQAWLQPAFPDPAAFPPASLQPVFQASAPGVAGRAAGLSLLLPGLGHYRLGSARSWLYGGLEVVGWIAFVERRSAASSARDDYRDLAWETGRLQLEPRMEADFEYYEKMTQWTRSGAFDHDAGAAGLQPEADPSTYNGSIWRRARQIFLGGAEDPSPGTPEYGQAIDYYQERAFGTAFLWDWTDAPAEQAALAEGITRSDDRYRQATTVLGALIANHVVSAIDAYLTGSSDASRFTVAPVRSPAGSGWEVRLRLELSR